MIHSYQIVPENNLLKINPINHQLLKIYAMQKQQYRLKNHQFDINIYADLQNKNQTLYLTLQQLIKTIENQLKPQLQSLKKQKTALFKALSYDERLRLKQNFTEFMKQKMQEKHYLLNKLQKLQNYQKQLIENSENHTNDALQSDSTINLLIQEKSTVQKQFNQLEIKKSIKQCEKNQKINNQCAFNLNNISPQDSISKSKDFSSSFQQSQSQNNPSSNQQLSNSHNNNQSRQYIYDHFDNDQPTQPKSKQILNSLQSELQPIKLTEIITFLQNQIHTLKNHKLSQLKQQKLRQFKINKKFKATFKFNQQKFRLMKANLADFKRSILSNNKLQ